MPNINLREVVEPVIAQTIETHGQGDEFIWALGFSLHPQHGAVGMLTIWMRGAALGSWNSQIVIVTNPFEWGLETERGEPFIIKAMEDLRQMRSNQLAEAMGQPLPSPEGLIQG